MKAMFDSNILMDYLNKVQPAKQILEQHKERYISVVTYMEVLVGTKTKQEEILVRAFLKKFKLVNITLEIADTAIDIRRESKIKLPDSLILATSFVENLTLFTRDAKDLTGKFTNVVVPYSL